MAEPVFVILPTTQEYDWGKIGSESAVAQFASSSKLPGFSLDKGKPYAELWMGTHPKSPSLVQSTKKPLSEYLAAHPGLMGEKITKEFEITDGNLPFLFKVLSINKALSIQSHPDKATAQKLHAEQPDIYKDPNHKPEMALALTDFEALCGFAPLPTIAAHIKKTTEFSSLIPLDIVNRFLALVDSSTAPGSPEVKIVLRDMFAALMTAEESKYKASIERLVGRFESAETSPKETELAGLIVKLNEQFPGDIGILCPFMLNYILLKPGEAIFLGAGEPHAYVSGDIIECMANSDNVIRAGLTPKLRDVPNLVATLTYNAADPSKHTVIPTAFSRLSSSTDVSILYNPPIPEFSVVQVQLAGNNTETHKAVDGPSIVVVTQGRGAIAWGSSGGELDVEKGTVFFIGAQTEIRIHGAAGTEQLVMYRAFVEA